MLERAVHDLLRLKWGKLVKFSQSDTKERRFIQLLQYCLRSLISLDFDCHNLDYNRKGALDYTRSEIHSDDVSGVTSQLYWGNIYTSGLTDNLS